MEANVNPSMVALARQARQMTQTELAKRLNVTQGKISKIESGHLGVTEEMLSNLGRVLRFPRKFFFQNERVYSPDIAFFRKHKTLSTRLLDGIVATMNVRRIHFEKLLKSAELDITPIPQLDVEDYGGPEQVARAIRHFLRLPRGPVENLTQVLEDAGIAVCPCDIPTNRFDGVQVPTETPYYFIIISNRLQGDRWRFTLAHELGHIVMHRVSSPDMEREADQFAAEFLMPEHDIKAELYDIKMEKLAALKKYWKVSMAALLQRALHLGKITPSQHRYLWIKLSHGGGRLREPPELDFPRESPTLLSELVALHLKELGYSPEELSDTLACEADEFYALYLGARPKKGLRLIPGNKERALA